MIRPDSEPPLLFRIALIAAFSLVAGMLCAALGLPIWVTGILAAVIAVVGITVRFRRCVCEDCRHFDRGTAMHCQEWTDDDHPRAWHDWACKKFRGKKS